MGACHVKAALPVVVGAAATAIVKAGRDAEAPLLSVTVMVMFGVVPALVGVQSSRPVARLKAAVEGLPEIDQVSESPSGSDATGAKA